MPIIAPEISVWELETRRKLWLDQLFAEYGIEQYLLWYTDPSTLTWTDHLEPLGIIYDCNALSLAKKPEPLVTAGLQRELVTYADLVLCSNKTLGEVGQHLRQIQVLPPNQAQAEYLLPVPASVLIEPPEREEQEEGYWKDVWNIISASMKMLATERNDWPFYALSSLEKRENNAMQDNQQK